MNRFQAKYPSIHVAGIVLWLFENDSQVIKCIWNSQSCGHSSPGCIIEQDILLNLNEISAIKYD